MEGLIPMTFKMIEFKRITTKICYSRISVNA